MQTEFRNRAFLPVVIPLAILAAIGVLVGFFALILLYLTREAAVALAISGAAGILVAVSLAASRDHLAATQTFAVGVAAGAPVLIGVLVAGGLIGGVDDADRQINAEPHAPQFVFSGIVPNEAGEEPPVLAAEDATTFCLPTDGGCEPTREWELSYTSEEIAYAFDNRDTVTSPHNLRIYAVPEDQLSTDEAISLNDLDNNYQVITPTPPDDFSGPAAETYRWAPPGEDASEDQVPIPGQAYFVCTVHVNAMYGVVTLTPA